MKMASQSSMTLPTRNEFFHSKLYNIIQYYTKVVHRSDELVLMCILLMLPRRPGVDGQHCGPNGKSAEEH